jgi:hypothetical protein
MTWQPIETAPKDGGPAFPIETTATPYAPGMSLRDWFAGQALMSMLSQPDKIGESTFAKAAELSYRFADAMIEARK